MALKSKATKSPQGGRQGATRTSKSFPSSTDCLDTSHLEGLRGVASLLVYIHHHELWAHDSAYDTIERAFGYRQRYRFMTLPFIRLIFNGGHFATAIFFVLSGYVLSIKPLTLINSPMRRVEQQAQLADYFSSAILRRWFRLFLPVFVTTFIYMTFIYAFGLRTPRHDFQATYSIEFKKWVQELLDFSFIFNRTTSPWLSYNDHLWSVAAEFRGSLVTYTCLFVLSRSLMPCRVICYAFLITYFLFLVTDGWFCAFFVAGALIRDLETGLSTSTTDKLARKSTVKWALLALGLYMGGVPTCVTSKCFRMNPGWYLLSPLSRLVTCDPKWISLLPGSVLFVSLAGHTWLKKALRTSICQYLGRHSYSLYLIHGPILCMFGDSLYALVAWPHGDRRMVHSSLDGWVGALPISTKGPLGLELAFLAVQVIILPVSLYMSHIVTQIVDEPCVRLSRTIDRLVLGKPKAMNFDIVEERL